MRSLFLLLLCTLMYATISAQSGLSVKCEVENKIPCAGARVGSLKAKVRGGTPPYKYTWSNPKLKGRKPRNVGLGTYTVTVTDARGKQEWASVEMPEPPPFRIDMDEIVNISHKGARDGRARVQAAGGTGPYEYEWDNGAKTQTIIGLPEGKYRVIAIDKYNCRASAEINIDPPKIEDVVIEEVVKPKPEETEESLPTIEPELEVETLAETQELSEVTEFKVGQILQVEKLYFKANAADIKEESYPVLDEIYDFLNSNKVVVEIGGHTNSIPSDEYCFKLSDSRAKTVADYLYVKGVPQDRVTYKGYGKTEPIADNSTAQGRKRNQRVEIKILSVVE